MARIVHVDPDGVVVRLTGWTALAALKREVRVPMRAIRSISTGRYGATGFRIRRHRDPVDGHPRRTLPTRRIVDIPVVRRQ